jgi:hypothetical protein
LQISQSIPLECWRAKAGADVARILAIEPGRRSPFFAAC